MTRYGWVEDGWVKETLVTGYHLRQDGQDQGRIDRAVGHPLGGWYAHLNDGPNCATFLGWYATVEAAQDAIELHVWRREQIRAPQVQDEKP